jgi:hypothetical protein
MGRVLIGKNGRGLVLIPRSGSHTIAAAWLQQYEPENYAAWQSGGYHPAKYFAIQTNKHDGALGVIVRDPVERFRSMVAKHNFTVDAQLELPTYGPLPQLPFTQYFRFEDQLQECADWLGITVPLPHLDGIDDAEKPILTAEQKARVCEIYATDIALWESLV